MSLWAAMSCAVVCSTVNAAASAAAGEQKPLWEFGLGVGALGFADYRGADTDSVYPVPVPYSTSRGIRAGMPSLRPALEIGPSVDVHLWKSAQRQVALDLRMPARTAITLEASPRRIGWLFAPALNLDITDPGGHRGWTAGLLAGPLFADRRYNEYFYSVAPQFATAARPAYRASGGYSGAQFIVSASKRFDRYWVGGFARYDALSGATFADSPLVKSNHYWTAGFGIAWMIGKSAQNVDAD
jgi:MipA family protein